MCPDLCVFPLGLVRYLKENFSNFLSRVYPPAFREPVGKEDARWGELEGGVGGWLTRHSVCICVLRLRRCFTVFLPSIVPEGPSVLPSLDRSPASTW